MYDSRSWKSAQNVREKGEEIGNKIGKNKREREEGRKDRERERERERRYNVVIIHTFLYHNFSPLILN